MLKKWWYPVILLGGSDHIVYLLYMHTHPPGTLSKPVWLACASFEHCCLLVHIVTLNTGFRSTLPPVVAASHLRVSFS